MSFSHVDVSPTLSPSLPPPTPHHPLFLSLKSIIMSLREDCKKKDSMTFENSRPIALTSLSIQVVRTIKGGHFV